MLAGSDKAVLKMLNEKLKGLFSATDMEYTSLIFGLESLVIVRMERSPSPRQTRPGACSKNTEWGSAHP